VHSVISFICTIECTIFRIYNFKVTIRDVVAKSGLLPMVPGAIVAREVSEFLATLAVAFQGSAVG
jgi:hypothetical protein